MLVLLVSDKSLLMWLPYNNILIHIEYFRNLALVVNVIANLLFALRPSQEDDSQQTMQELRDSAQMDEVDGSAALSDIRLDDTINESKEEDTTTDDKVQNTADKVEEDTAHKVEEETAQKTDQENEKDSEVQLERESDITIKSQPGTQRDRPKSVLKNKTPTPVITTSTAPNSNITNPHRDRECCIIS